MRIREATRGDQERLLDIWLQSVRATHGFLSQDDIQSLLPLVRDHALKQLELWVLVAEDSCESMVIGFMGLVDYKLEAIFLAPEYLRQGGGRLLVEHAQRLKGPLWVDVNEQNIAAREFYHSLGFVVEGRSDVDSAGRPFPLLHLRQIVPGDARQA
jgi:putative acetyltransferase